MQQHVQSSVKSTQVHSWDTNTWLLLMHTLLVSCSRTEWVLYKLLKHAQRMSNGASNFHLTLSIPKTLEMASYLGLTWLWPKSRLDIFGVEAKLFELEGYSSWTCPTCRIRLADSHFLTAVYYFLSFSITVNSSSVWKFSVAPSISIKWSFMICWNVFMTSGKQATLPMLLCCLCQTKRTHNRSLCMYRRQVVLHICLSRVY